MRGAERDHKPPERRRQPYTRQAAGHGAPREAAARHTQGAGRNWTPFAAGIVEGGPAILRSGLASRACVTSL